MEVNIETLWLAIISTTIATGKFIFTVETGFMEVIKVVKDKGNGVLEDDGIVGTMPTLSKLILSPELIATRFTDSTYFAKQVVSSRS